MKNTISITVNHQLFDLVSEGSKLPINSKAEEKIIQFLEYVDTVNKAKEQLLLMLQDEANAIMPNLSSIEGEKIRLINRFFGDKYKIEDEVLAEEYIKEVVTKKVDSEAVDRFIEENGYLPDGIAEKPRVKKLVIYQKKHE